MKLNAACTTAVLALLLAGVLTSHAHRDYRDQSLDLLRLLAPSLSFEPHNRWDQAPRIDEDLDNRGFAQHDEEASRDMDEDLRASSKRSAVATALNSGRRRRQPTPALGVLNDMGSFFDSLRGNLETLASLSPEQRSTWSQEPPTVVHAPSSGGGGGGTGMRRIYALRPLKPTGYNRSYDRRSGLEPDVVYPAANHHDPGLLWTGLGR